MFLKEMRKNRKKQRIEEFRITKKQMQIFERIKGIEQQIEKARQDYYNLEFIGHFRTMNWDYGRFTYDQEYIAVLQSYIKNKIKLLEQEKMKLLKGEED